jgi:hypothetical protein
MDGIGTREDEGGAGERADPAIRAAGVRRVRWGAVDEDAAERVGGEKMESEGVQASKEVEEERKDRASENEDEDEDEADDDEEDAAAKNGDVNRADKDVDDDEAEEDGVACTVSCKSPNICVSLTCSRKICFSFSSSCSFSS